MRYRNPSFGGFAEVGADFVEGLTLRVTAGECGDRGGEAAGLGFGTDNRGQGDDDIDS
jgi:hypothetical protein